MEWSTDWQARISSIEGTNACFFFLVFDYCNDQQIFSCVVTVSVFFFLGMIFFFFFFWCCSMFYHYYYYYRLTIFFKLLFPRIFFDFFSFYLLWSLVESINSVILFLWFFCNSLEIANSFRIHLYTHTRTHTRARAMTRYPPPLHTYTHTHIIHTCARARALHEHFYEAY